jgi:hypothetical protein
MEPSPRRVCLRTDIFSQPVRSSGYPARCKNGEMAKRLMIAVVGAGIGSLAGLLVSFLGAGNSALIIGAAVGAVVPLVVLGQPGR